mgnify:CR=1 FL=1
MSAAEALAHRLRNTPVRAIMKALERDSFVVRRSTSTGGHIYVHRDGRRAVIHYHHGSDTLTRKVLGSILEGTQWNVKDLERLDL